MKLVDVIASTEIEDGVIDIAVILRYAPVMVRVTIGAKAAVGWHRLTPRDEIIKLSNGEISIQHSKLYQDSGSIGLTPREMDVMIYLNKNRGRFVSIKEFDDKYDFGENSPRIYIYQIRRKLNQDPYNGDIVTAHRVGYMLKPVTD